MVKVEDVCCIGYILTKNGKNCIRKINHSIYFVFSAYTIVINYSNYVAYCEQHCIYGYCDDPGICTCINGYHGSMCNQGLMMLIFKKNTQYSWLQPTANCHVFMEIALRLENVRATTDISDRHAQKGCVLSLINCAIYFSKNLQL